MKAPQQPRLARVARALGWTRTLALSVVALACEREPGLFELDPGASTLDFARELDRLVPELMGETGVPGVGIALIEDGETVWMSGYGVADRESSLAIDPHNTVFQAASISKTVVAWTVMDLVEDGLLDLDQPVEDVLSRWQFPDGPFDPAGVTPRRLLSHTAGTSLFGYPGFLPSEVLPTLEESLNGLSNGQGRVEIQLQPGTRWAYSGGGFTVLQLAIEEVTGLGFADVVAERVLEPLGMSSSSFEWREDLRQRTATAHGKLGNAIPTKVFVASASGGLHTTVADLGRLVESYVDQPGGSLRGRSVLSPESLDRMEVGPSVAVDYGLGHAILTLENGRQLIGHAGVNPGWRSFWALDRTQGRGIVVLSNSQHEDDVPERLICAWTRSVVGSRVAIPLRIQGCS